MAKKILVTKANGEQEPFDPAKLVQSLQRSGASPKQTNEILRRVRRELWSGITTHDIYKYSFALLRKLASPIAARYSLKRAVLELGPSGFPFERFVGEIFKAKGFTVETGKMLHGSCVEHEVDLIAENKDKFIVGDVKFHNELGLKSDLKVALYVKARVDDLKKWRSERGERHIDEGWLITNTKFTKAAVSYANCSGLKIASWTYPRYGNLQDLIEEASIHPITCLTSLSRQEKSRLIEAGVVLCKTLEESKILLGKMGIRGLRLEKVLAEGKQLCQSRYS